MNPFLSEFRSNSRLSVAIKGQYGGYILASISFLWALLAILFSCWSHSDCMRLMLSAGVTGESASILVGYVAELNHGIFFLIAVPVFIWVAHGFILSGSDALEQLASGQRLSYQFSDGKTLAGSATIDWIAALNRRIARRLPVICLALGLLFVAIQENRTYNQNVLGWVQARFSQEWVGRPLNSFGMAQLPDTVSAALHVKPSRTDVVRIEKVNGGPQTGDSPLLMYCFLAIALGLQATFIAFVGWLIVKILIMLFVLNSGIRKADPTIRRKTTSGLVIDLDFYDSENRFGLKSFDAVYNAFLIVVSIGSLGFAFQRAFNSMKGTTWFGSQSLGFLGQILLPIILLVVYLAILIIPGSFFNTYTRKAKQSTLKRLEEKKAVAADREEKDVIEREIERVRAQTMWPYPNKTAWVLIVAVFALLVLLPLGLSNISPDWVRKPLDAAIKSLPETLCNCQH